MTVALDPSAIMSEGKMTITSADVRAMGLYAYEAAREMISINGAPKRGESGWERYRHCTRKLRHHDKPQGVAVGMHAYRCNYCEGYHVTGKPRSGRKKEADQARDILASAIFSQDDKA